MSDILIEIDDCNIETDAIENEKDDFYRINVNNLLYNEFFTRFMRPNKPVVICGIANEWECMNWVSQTKNAINFDYLKLKIPSDVMVPIANCNKIYFNSHEKSEMKFNDFLDYWKRKIVANEIESEQNDLFYLKDWHLKNQLPNYDFYQIPIYFASDWLNEFCIENNRDDYRFVYMGPKGSW